MLAFSLRLGITRNPEHLLRGTSLGIEYLRQGKNISGDERGGFRLATVNLPLSDASLGLFIQGREDWLEEGLLVSARKNKRGRIVEEGSSSAQAGSAQPNVAPPFDGIPPPPSYYGGPQEQAWGWWCTGTPTKLCGAQRKLRGALRTISPTATKCGHNWRLIQANAAQLGEGNANIAYELGRLHLVEPDQFVGGDVQPYYEQGYYYQDYQHQPPAED
jgi:hypothetical protein